MADLKIRKIVVRQMKLNRVVVTGYGLTSLLSEILQKNFGTVSNGRLAIGEITKFDHSESAVHNAAEVQDSHLINTFAQRYQPFDQLLLCAQAAAQR